MLKYPTAFLYSDKKFFQTDSNDDIVDKLVLNCVEAVYTGEVVQQIDATNREELRAWIDDLPVPAYTSMRKFFTDLPALYYEIKYKNDMGNDRTIKINSLEDFFTLR